MRITKRTIYDSWEHTKKESMTWEGYPSILLPNKKIATVSFRSCHKKTTRKVTWQVR